MSTINQLVSVMGIMALRQFATVEGVSTTGTEQELRARVLDHLRLKMESTPMVGSQVSTGYGPHTLPLPTNPSAVQSTSMDANTAGKQKSKLKQFTDFIGIMKGDTHRDWDNFERSVEAALDYHEIVAHEAWNDFVAGKITLDPASNRLLYNVLSGTLSGTQKTLHMNAVTKGDGTALFRQVRKHFVGDGILRRGEVMRKMQQMRIVGTVAEIMSDARKLYAECCEVNLGVSEADFAGNLLSQLTKGPYKDGAVAIIAAMRDETDIDLENVSHRLTVMAASDPSLAKKGVKKVENKEENNDDTTEDKSVLMLMKQFMAAITSNNQHGKLKTCWRCKGKHENPAKDCSIAKDDVECSFCHAKGHLVDYCFKKRRSGGAQDGTTTSKTSTVPLSFANLSLQTESLTESKLRCEEQHVEEISKGNALKFVDGSILSLNHEQQQAQTIMLTVDSAATESGTGMDSHLQQQVPQQKSFTLANDDTTVSKVRGTIRGTTSTAEGDTVTIERPNVNLISGMTQPLLSVHQLTQDNHKVTFQPGQGVSYILPNAEPEDLPPTAIPLIHKGGLWKLPVKIPMSQGPNEEDSTNDRLCPMTTRSKSNSTQNNSPTSSQTTTGAIATELSNPTTVQVPSGSIIPVTMASPPSIIIDSTLTEHQATELDEDVRSVNSNDDDVPTLTGSVPQAKGTFTQCIPGVADDADLQSVSRFRLPVSPCQRCTTAVTPIQLAEAREKLVAKYHRLLRHHRSLSHVSLPAVIENLRRSGNTEDFSTLDLNLVRCSECATSNIQRTSVGNHHAPRATRQCEFTHADIVGPVAPAGPGGLCYTFQFVDEVTREGRSYHSSSNSGNAAVRAFRQYISDMGGIQKFSGATFKSDCDVFEKTEFTSFLNSHMIRRTASTPERHELNGVVERRIGINGDMVRPALCASGIPGEYWVYAWKYSDLVKNHLISRVLGMSPVEAATGRKPDLNLFHPFGCKIVAKDYRDKSEHLDISTDAPQTSVTSATNKKRRHKRRKLEDKGITGVFLGIDTACSYRTYIIGIPDNLERPSKIASIRRSRDVQFFPDEYIFSPSPKPIKILYKSIYNPPNTTTGANIAETATTNPNGVINVPLTPSSCPGGMRVLQVKDTSDGDVRVTMEDEDGVIYYIEPDREDEDDMIVHKRGRLYIKYEDHYDACMRMMDKALGESETPTACPVPRTYKEALTMTDSKHWVEAIQKEKRAFERKEVFQEMQLSDVPKDEPIYRLFNLFKRKSDGTYKVRTVLNGKMLNADRLGETFSPTSSLENWRALLAAESWLRKYRWRGRQVVRRVFDVDNAFLNATIDKDIYCYPPDGYYIGEKKPVWKLDKAVYGLPQAPRLYYLWFDKLSRKLGLKKSETDPCVYYQIGTDGKMILAVNIHVDDNFIIGEKVAVETLVQMVKSELGIKDMGEPERYLGVECEVDSDGDILLSQGRYIRELLRDFNLQDAHAQLVPHSTTRLERVDHCSENLPYNKLVGDLLYAARCTHPEIAYDVGALSRHLKAYGDEHFQAGKRVLRYLKGVADVPLAMKATNTDRLIEIWVDSDHCAGDTTDSVGGYMIKMFGVPVAWGSRLIKVKCPSASDAEIVSLHDALYKGVALAKLMVDIKLLDENEATIYVYEDNQGAFKNLKNGLGTDGLRHLRIKLGWIREMISDELIRMYEVRSENNPADMNTKPLGGTLFRKHRAFFNQGMAKFEELIKAKHRGPDEGLLLFGE